MRFKPLRIPEQLHDANFCARLITLAILLSMLIICSGEKQSKIGSSTRYQPRPVMGHRLAYHRMEIYAIRKTCIRDIFFR